MISLFYRFFFILRLDLIIGLIYVIAQQTQKIRPCIVAWRKALPTDFGPFFKFLGNQGELQRTETTKNFCWCI